MHSELQLADMLRAQHGVITVGQLRALGFSGAERRGLARRGRLVSHSRGILIDPAARVTFEQRIAYACLATKGAAESVSAARLWQWRGVPAAQDKVVHVLLPWERHIDRPEGVVIRRTNDLIDRDLVRRDDGIVLTSPPRTIVDLAGVLPLDAVESIIEQALERKMVSVTMLRTMCARLASTRRSGIAELASLLDDRPIDLKPVRSDYELRLAAAMQQRGFPMPVREHRLDLGGGWVVHPDLGLLAEGFFVEVDHRTWHAGRLQHAYDAERDQRMRLAGYVVERVTDTAIDNDLAGAVELLWRRWLQVRAQRNNEAS